MPIGIMGRLNGVVATRRGLCAWGMRTPDLLRLRVRERRADKFLHRRLSRLHGIVLVAWVPKFGLLPTSTDGYPLRSDASMMQDGHLAGQAAYNAS